MSSQTIQAFQIPTNLEEIDQVDPTKLESEAALHLVADGYADFQAFWGDCQQLVKELALIAPFNEFAKSSRFAVYTYFESATSYKFPIGATAPNPPLSTALGAYYQTGNQPADGVLHIDYKKFVALGQRLEVWDDVLMTNLPLLVTPDSLTTRQYVAGAILILMPPVQVGDGASGNYIGLSPEDTLRVEMEHLPMDEEPIYFAATTCNQGFERLAARAIALKLGLGDESEQYPKLPTQEAGLVLNTRPNLIYASDSTEAALAAQILKWQPLTSQTTFIVHPRVDSATMSAVDETSNPLIAAHEPIGLWEGGGGYTNGVYRPAHDCLMRRKPGIGRLLFKASQHPFCPVCRPYLLKAVTGQYSTKRAADSVTLATQRSEYNKVHWDTTQEYDAQKPAPSTFIVGPNHEAFKYPSYQSGTGPKHIPLAFWGYTCHFSDQLPPKSITQSANTLNAFYLDQVQVHQSQYYDGPTGDKQKKVSEPLDVRDVFSRVGFHSLTVTFENVSGAVPAPYEFVIADYIENKNYKLKRSWGGHLGGDHLYQTGWQLLLVEDRPEWPRLEVELSIVMRGPAPDFDPGGVAEVLKCYPQIQFRWVRRVGVTLGVKQFEGTVQAVVNTKHYMYDANACAPGSGNHFMEGHHMAGTTVVVPNNAGYEGANDMSCFTDSNLSAAYNYYSNTLLTRHDLEFPAPFTKPTWAAIFDYYAPHVAQGINNSFSKSFVGAHYHNPAVRQGQVRKMYVHHQVAEPPCEGDGLTSLFITKFPRQGGYDNIHVNGYMGKHQAFAAYPGICDATAIAKEDVIAAPFCGVDCFHMHWRWSLLSETIAGITSSTSSKSTFPGIGDTPIPNPFNSWQTAPAYRGWSTKRSHSQLGAPLIPPNQRLNMHLEALDHSKPRRDKIVDYKVTVSAPAPGENQVILEQGMGWAMIESELLAAKVGPVSVLYAPPMPHGLAPLSDIVPGINFIKRLKDPEVAFSKLYDYIRFHHEFTRLPSGDPTFDVINPFADKIKIFNHTQVPDGTSNPTLTWPIDWKNLNNPDVALEIYRRRGDMLTPLYPDGQKVLIEGIDFDNIAIEDV